MTDRLKKAKEQRSKKINRVENIKSLKTPQEAFEQLKEYAKKGYESIPKEDKEFFLKCFGIFDRPATPEKFMLRVRIPGGRVTALQAKKLGEVAKKYGNDYIDLTTRMQVELRFLKIKDLPQLLEELESVGITTYQTGIDNFRNIVTDPLDSIAKDSVIESFGLLEKLQNFYLKKPQWIGSLPRKFNTSITGSLSNRCNVYGHDCCFVTAFKNGRYGYNVYLGGKVGKIAQNADVFLGSEDEVLRFYEALITVFKTYGFRDNRNKNRLHFLIKAVGMEEFIKAVSKAADFEFESAGETLCSLEHFDAKYGRVELKDGSFAIHAVVPAGIFTGSDMIEASEIAQKYGNGEIRLTVEQNLYITGIKEEDIKSVFETPFFHKYQNIDTPYFNNLISCVGAKHCPYGVIEGKPDALAMSEYLSSKISLSDGKIRLYWSACVKGCGIHEFGDIGFIGAKAKVDGITEPGVDIVLGGSLTKTDSPAHTILKAVPLRFAKYLVEEIVLEYAIHRRKNESFEKFFERVLSLYTYSAISFMATFNYAMKKEKFDYRFSLPQKPETGKNEHFEIFDFGCRIYKDLVGEKPYLEILDFRPLGNQKPANPSKIIPEIPKKTGNLIYKMISPNPNERYMAFSECLNELKLW
ncbi:nitrite/sulfite reductase [Nitrosophilus alvini]|uniref:nitrite/sulfite reductase n=1 Tax=Nitrosophilus alvini TaxID=2714855 RepID=UPI00190D353F|nr:ferredoxin--nitrite reductase [Nitrosophilus alvini]